MKTIFYLTLLILAFACLPEKRVPGVYLNNFGDSLRMRTDHSFRVEVLNPDTAVLKQLKFPSGRWHKENRKVYLTVATKSMGDYWQCLPFKATYNHLKRPVGCTEEKSKSMHFKKVQIKARKNNGRLSRKERKKREEGEE
jgi:hypothetical protein